MTVSRSPPASSANAAARRPTAVGHRCQSAVAVQRWRPCGRLLFRRHESDSSRGCAKNQTGVAIWPVARPHAVQLLFRLTHEPSVFEYARQPMAIDWARSGLAGDIRIAERRGMSAHRPGPKAASDRSCWSDYFRVFLPSSPPTAQRSAHRAANKAQRGPQPEYVETTASRSCLIARRYFDAVTGVPHG